MDKIRLFKHQRLDGQSLFTWRDGLVLAILVAGLYLGIRLAFNAPGIIQGPQISLDPAALPWYTLLSLGRMAAAYLLSLLFSIVYGRLAAYNRRADQILMPLLDVLQSIPILSFLPVVLLGLSGFLPENVAVELASIILIFTSQAWNLTFAWYQSLKTIPTELREASAIFRLNGWFQLKTMELPFAAISLVWNSMMSWAGGWFFLMAAEIFTVGQRDFRLPGLGAYLHAAASQNDFRAITYGVLTLVLTIVLLDQFVWRPLLAWSERFKVEMIESDYPATSWFYDAIHNSRLVNGLERGLFTPLAASFDRWMLHRLPPPGRLPARQAGRTAWFGRLLAAIAGLAALFALVQAGLMLAVLPLTAWAGLFAGLGATLLRVLVALILALVWTIPVGVAIGTNRRVATVLQPLVQVVASIPATALFPIFLLFMLGLPNGLNLAAVLLMLMGTQWYLLFNIIAGASAIPQDLKYTSTLIHLNRWQRWRTLILPALYPYIITGAITASGGAWNASIVSEYVSFSGQTLQTIGIGATIAQATAAGNYPLLLASTLGMILAVVLINRIFWRRLYLLSEERYRME